jgi:hypothetical protein
VSKTANGFVEVAIEASAPCRVQFVFFTVMLCQCVPSSYASQISSVGCSCSRAWMMFGMGCQPKFFPLRILILDSGTSMLMYNVQMCSPSDVFDQVEYHLPWVHL